jgi:hypothetical protein
VPSLALFGLSQQTTDAETTFIYLKAEELARFFTCKVEQVFAFIVKYNVNQSLQIRSGSQTRGCVYSGLGQGFSNCGTRTTNGTPATIDWYTGIVRKNQMIKTKKSLHKCSYIEKLINLIFI